MNQTEFHAMLEASALAARVRDWQPTDEELHRFFWVDYRPSAPGPVTRTTASGTTITFRRVSLPPAPEPAHGEHVTRDQRGYVIQRWRD